MWTSNNSYSPQERSFVADPAWFRLIPQSCITQKIFENTYHNAIWDFYVTPQGRIFLSLCAEINYPEIVRLYEYIPRTNEFRLHFKLEDRVLQHPQAIRASKMHTSFCQMKDGRLIMTTHTTAKSVLHPDWMPEAYYTHPWEGYQGSNILLYDPDTGALENRGIPVPHESIYGAKYDAEHDALYFTGYLRGHLYRLDLLTNHLTDYGKITEYGSFRIADGPDGNYYCSSRSGNFFRINRATQEIEELGLQLPDNNGKFTRNHRVITFTAVYGDRLYFTSCYSKGLWSYHPATNTMRCEGSLLPCIGAMAPDPDAETILAYAGIGLSIDDNGCFWYGFSNSALHLVKWDLLRNESPRDMGIIGTPERAVVTLSEMHYYKGRLYLSDTNHAFDAPGVATIDLSRLNEATIAEEACPILTDGLPYYSYLQSCLKNELGYKFLPEGKFFPLHEIYPHNDFEEQLSHIKNAEETNIALLEVRKKNEFRFTNKCIPVLLWQGPLTPGHSTVFDLHFAGDTLIAVAGDECQKYEIAIREGKVVGLSTVNWAPPSLPHELLHLCYPCVPGRQYKAVPSAFSKWNNGRMLIGTADGMLAMWDGSHVFGLGSAAPCGAVNAMACNDAHTILYGVAGDSMDLGYIFSYDDLNGLRWRGLAHREDFDEGVTFFANELSAIAINEDGTRMAIGSKDRLGVILVYEI